MICPQQPVHPSILLEAKRYATENLIQKAIAIFRRAQILEPEIDLDPFTPEEKEQNPKTLAHKISAEEKIQSGARLVEEGKINEAIILYKEAQAFVDIAAEQWNSLCWVGSLYRQAAKVMFACEMAVEMEPDNVGMRDSRGLARALTGNTKSALADFQAFVDEREGPEAEQRQAWIDALKAGRDPFTDEVLNGLLEE